MSQSNKLTKLIQEMDSLLQEQNSLEEVAVSNQAGIDRDIITTAEKEIIRNLYRLMIASKNVMKAREILEQCKHLVRYDEDLEEGVLLRKYLQSAASRELTMPQILQEVKYGYVAYFDDVCNKQTKRVARVCGLSPQTVRNIRWERKKNV